MSKVSVITRCYNRLEYTSMCIRSIRHLTDYEDYNHIIIDQGSTDGTQDFLNSLIKENFYKLKVQFNETNSGDAGGMLDGFKLTDPDCKYIFQFDNDCEVITEDYMEKLVSTMDENPNIGLIMLKRNGVGRHITPTNVRRIGDITAGDVTQATCCMIIRKELLETIGIWYTGTKIGWGFSISAAIRKLGYLVLKTNDIQVNHIDGGYAKHGQSKKYPSYYAKDIGVSNYRIIDYKQN